jgi:hypothetical protein
MSGRNPPFLWPLVLLTVLGAGGLAAVVPGQGLGQASEAQNGDHESQVRATCSGCHAFPPADILPRSAWRDAIVRMHFIREKRLPPPGPPARIGETVKLPQDLETAVSYYTSRAPERLAAPEPWPAPGTGSLTFARHDLSVTGFPPNPAVSNVRLLDLDGDGRLDLLGTEMRHGVVFRGKPSDPASALAVVASIPHPAHVDLNDVDGDGRQDLLVGELGEFFPGDHAKGAVIWLRGVAPN